MTELRQLLQRIRHGNQYMRDRYDDSDHGQLRYAEGGHIVRDLHLVNPDLCQERSPR